VAGQAAHDRHVQPARALLVPSGNAAPVAPLTNVEPPFRDDSQFWTSVGCSTDAFWSLLIATALVLALGRYAAVAFVVPVVLIGVSARSARASSARTRPLFASRNEWRQAERQAVAAAIPGALVRHI